MRRDQEGPDAQRRLQRRVPTNLKNPIQGSPPGQPAERQCASLDGGKLKAATLRGRGRHKIAGRNAEQGKRRIRSASKAAAQTNLNNLSRELLLHSQGIRRSGSPLARELLAATVRRNRLRKIGGKTEERHKGPMGSSNKSAVPINPKNPSKSTPTQSPDGPIVQSAREKSQRGDGEGEKSAATRQESRGDRQSATPERKQAETSRVPPQENAQQRRQGAENTRPEQGSAPPAERREANVQQQPQRPQQKAQGEKSGGAKTQQQKSRGDDQKSKKGDSKEEGKDQEKGDQ